MRISDWSSDVCSSDLEGRLLRVDRPADALVSGAVRHVERDLGAEFADGYRSEEHTSELQSLMRISYAVFCLKKKKQKKNIHSTSKRIRTNNICKRLTKTKTEVNT